MQPIQHRRGIHWAELFAGLGRESAFTGHFFNTVERGDLRVEIFGRGPLGSTLKLTIHLSTLVIFFGDKKRKGLKIACLEEIGFRKGWLIRGGLEASVVKL
jgi:hypothetical protein